jgi:AraC-like DNA-binding protein
MTAEQKIAFLQSVMQSGYELNPTMRIVAAIKFVHMSIYCLLIFNISEVKKYLKINFPIIQDEKRKWSRIIKFCFVGYLCAFAIFYVTVDLIGYSLEFDYSITFAMSAFIFVIGYSGLSKPEYLYEAHNGAKYENSTLEETEADQYLEKLLTYMEMEEPYLDGDLKLEDLSQQLEIPRHHLSQIINQKLDKNFFEFLNSYRIEKAKKILTDPANDYKILRVALEAGFNNKTTFNNAFKNEVGTTPSRYRAECNNDEVLARTS